MTIESLTAFFGWCTVINLGFFLVSVGMLVLMRGFASKMHGKMFGITPEQARVIYFQYLGQYKILIIVFNLVPYLVLRVLL